MASFLPAVEDLTAQQRAVYDMLPLDLTRGLLLTRSSAAPYLSLGQSFQDSWLPASVRELIIVRVGALTGADYEIHYHVPQARACGVPDELIDKVVSGSLAVGAEDLDALMAFVDQLVGAVEDTPPAVDRLQQHYSNHEIAEIVLLVGHYVMTSLFVKVLGIRPEKSAASGASSPEGESSDEGQGNGAEPIQ